MKRVDSLVVFVGPSLPAAEVKAIAPCRVLPPARQGDLWRAIALEPRAIALVDGVFEAVPSVWHHEILAAIDAGIAVFGGASMGALRASELWRDGMVGVGRIFGWYRDGIVRDDSEVALLHAGAEHRFEAFTVALVNVRHNAERAREAKVLSAREARTILAVAQRIFFKDRTWERIVEEIGRHWSTATHARWHAFAKRGLEDLKAVDARACIETAASFAKSSAVPMVGASGRTPSSLVRRRRLHDGATAVDGKLVENARIVSSLSAHPDARSIAEAGLRTLLLAGWACEQGLEPDRTQSEQMALPSGAGLDRAESARMLEALALEATLLANASRIVSDGPSLDEGLAFEARRRGLWSRAAKRLAHQRS